MGLRYRSKDVTVEGADIMDGGIEPHRGEMRLMLL